MRIPARVKLTNCTRESRKRFEIEHVEMPSVMIVVDKFGVNWSSLGSQHLPAVEMFLVMLNFAREVYVTHFTCWNGCNAPVVGNVCGSPVCESCMAHYVGEVAAGRRKSVEA